MTAKTNGDHLSSIPLARFTQLAVLHQRLKNLKLLLVFFTPIVVVYLEVIHLEQGIIVFFHGKHGSWADLLTGRLRGRLGDMTDRVRILPRYCYDDYMNLVALSDVVLDTVHFNGGATTFDALTVGTPVVTMPGPFMRGRQTVSLYQRMNVMDCVVSTPGEYVAMAVRLASDPSYRGEIKQKILSANHRIFEDVDTVRELERLLVEMVRNVPLPEGN